MRQWRLEERRTPARAVELVPQREFAFDEDVLAARSAPDGRLLAAALLDSSVRIHYMDSGKVRFSTVLVSYPYSGKIL